MTRELTATATSRASRKIVELVHGSLEEGHAGKRPAAQPLTGVLEHAGGKIEGDHRFELLGQMGQERSRSATEVGRGLPPGSRNLRERLPERIDDVRPVRVEKKLLVPRRLAAPLLGLVIKLFLGQGRDKAPETYHCLFLAPAVGVSLMTSILALCDAPMMSRRYHSG